MEALLIPLLNAFSRLPWKVLYFLSDFLQWLVFGVIGYRKKVIFENLRNSFPHKSEKELKAIAEEFYKYFGDLIVETVKLSSCSKEEIVERVVITDEATQMINDLETGAVIVMGHRGNWELANLFSSAVFTPETITVYKPLANQAFEKWFKDLRTRFGTNLVAMRKIYAELEKPRMKPYIVVLANDQSPNPTSGYWTRFLNQDTGVFRGAENMARAYDIPVFFGDVEKVEGKRGYYKITFQVLTDRPNEEPLNNILEKQVNVLEEKIKAQPGNWLWSHKRWKHAKPAILKKEQIFGGSKGENGKEN